MMMSKEDLIPFNQLTEEEHKKLCRKAGKKSGEVRRKKRDMKEAMKLLLDMPVTNEKTKETMASLGITDTDMTNQMAMLIRMMQQATSGNIKAAEFVRDIAGEKPSERLEVTSNDIKITVGEDSDD